MSYVFKEKITYSQYEKFIKKQIGFSYMQEDKWAYVKNNRNHMIVAVTKNEEVCAIAHILIKKKILGYQFYIPNGYVLDFTNKSLLEFLTENIVELAKSKKAYAIDIYPNIDINSPLKEEINKNLLSLKYKYRNKYIDKSINIIVSIDKCNHKFENNYYLKRGIYFEKTNKIDDVDRFENIINENYFNKDLVTRLLENYKERITFIFAKLDLVFYENYLKEAKNEKELNKIQELLQISDEIDIGCAIIIEPFNKSNEICDYIYNTEKESFENLKITEGMFNIAFNYCKKNGYKKIKVSNTNLDENLFIKNYNGKIINYIGNYRIILNKFVDKLNK